MKQMTLKDKMIQLMNTLGAIINDHYNADGRIVYQDMIEIRNKCNDVIDGLDAILDATMFDID